MNFGIINQGSKIFMMVILPEGFFFLFSKIIS
jgi:hypothetical protein